ncbi:MAG: amylo-alpha-1,6-glucosidase [Phycisphaerae bacterium]
MASRRSLLDDNDVLNVYGPGQLVAFSAIDGKTDYDHDLVARTAGEGAGLVVKAPGTCRLHFGTEARETRLAGDFFHIRTERGETRGAMLDAFHLLVEGPCDVSNETEGLAIEQQDGRTLVAAAAKLDGQKLTADLDAAIAARREWLDGQILPTWVEGDSIPTAVKAMSVMKTQVCSGQGMLKHRWTTPDRWPHKDMWLWDSAFHAIGWRHADPGLAREMISAVLDAQGDDGMVSHRANPHHRSGITQPPVLALAAMLIDQVDPDEEWLREVFPKLQTYVRWDIENRGGSDGGLLRWHTNPQKNNRCDESGMDNSTRFEFDEPLEAVDFNSLLALECEVLGHMSHALADRQAAAEWTERYLDITDRINERLWDEEAGIYMDRLAESGRRTGVLASAGFLPLVCGAAGPQQAQRLAEHLQNPETFGTPVGVPSIAACDSEHYSKDMWRGPVWINLNWLIAMGFERSSLDDVAADLRRRTCREIERRYMECGSIFEFYDDRGQVPPPALPRKGTNDPTKAYNQVIFDYGWSCTLYLDMIMRR